MSSKKTILDEVLQFIETEKELYGAFTPNYVKSDDAENQPDKTALSIEKSTENVTPKGIESVEEKPQELTLEEKLNLCTTLEALKEFCEQCVQLKTDLENTNLVFGVGNPAADLMIIGEAPGEQEDIQREPFVGKAGQLLDKIIGAINFSRDDIYISNILKHRPPENRNPSEEERKRSLPFLLRQIELVQPKMILCLGKVAGTTLLQKDDALKNMRGSFHKFRNTELTVTYHPAALLRNPNWKRPTWEDVQMVRKRYDELGCKP